MRKLKVDYIPGEKLWEVYWGEMGTARSLKKLSLWCKNNNILNPVTQKPPTKDGCFKAMWRYASLKENHEKAYAVLNKAMMDVGDYWTMDEFLEKAESNSKSAYQQDDKRRKRFLRRNGYISSER